MIIVLVCGGREFHDYAQVTRVLDTVCGWSDDGKLLIVNGAARGADQLSTLWAQEHGQQYVEVPVTDEDWRTYGGMAGPLRNQRMLDTHKPTQGIAFRGGKGTLDMLSRLFGAGVNTWVVGENR